MYLTTCCHCPKKSLINFFFILILTDSIISDGIAKEALSNHENASPQTHCARESVRGCVVSRGPSGLYDRQLTLCTRNSLFIGGGRLTEAGANVILLFSFFSSLQTFSNATQSQVERKIKKRFRSSYSIHWIGPHRWMDGGTKIEMKRFNITYNYDVDMNIINYSIQCMYG